MSWNGGGCYTGENISSYNILNKLFEWYLEHNINLQLTFTNPCLEKEDIYDRYCNTILKIASEYSNISILIVSDILEDYIKNKYPNIKLDRSLVATRKNQFNYDINKIKEDLNKYNQIVLPKIYLKDWNFLNLIPRDDRERIEIIINETCPIDCPYSYSHYLKYGLIQLYGNKDSIDTGCMQPDRFKDPFVYYRAEQNNAILKLSELNQYEENGFISMKISGRYYPIVAILQTIDYFIKPEYRTDVLTFLFKPFENEQYNNFIFDN